MVAEVLSQIQHPSFSTLVHVTLSIARGTGWSDASFSHTTPMPFLIPPISPRRRRRSLPVPLPLLVKSSFRFQSRMTYIIHPHVPRWQGGESARVDVRIFAGGGYIASHGANYSRTAKYGAMNAAGNAQRLATPDTALTEHGAGESSRGNSENTRNSERDYCCGGGER